MTLPADSPEHVVEYDLVLRRMFCTGCDWETPAERGGFEAAGHHQRGRRPERRLNA